MFQITKDPSSGSSIQCLAKNYSNGSMSSVDMDLVCVMVLLYPFTLQKQTLKSDFEAASFPITPVPGTRTQYSKLH